MVAGSRAPVLAPSDVLRVPLAARKTNSRARGAIRSLVSAAVSAEADANYIPAEIVDASDDFKSKALVSSQEQYAAMYKRSIEDPDGFWGDIASEFHWDTKWDASKPIYDCNFDVTKGPISARWFEGGTTNLAFNCLDRHVEAGRGGSTALLWEGNRPGDDAVLSYSDVLEEVCKLGNWLRAQGVKKGDNVTIYMPMVAELPIAMLACARIGAVHSVVFAGFSAEALAGRMLDSKPAVVLTCSNVSRGAKTIALKSIVDKAMDICATDGHKVSTALVYDNPNVIEEGATFPMAEGRDVLWHEALAGQPSTCPVEWMDAEDPLFMLYTSGSTGTPKGVVHSTAGYMIYAATTFKYIFDHRDGDVFFCTADCGWITGHTYLAYGPLLNGATNVVFEGVPSFPDAGRLWDIVDKYQVTSFYTAPTAVRALKKEGNDFVARSSRKSLRLLGSVGEPINPEAWGWYHQVVGEGRCPIVDTWWQTETGGILIAPLPGGWGQKPGSATLPFFGVEPAVLNEKGEELEGAAEGLLAIKSPWPSMMRTIFNNHLRYEEAYFSPFPGYYFPGDGCRRDADGYYWITGRVDDVINVSGHRIGTAEVESALVTHDECVEAAVVGYDHDVKGQGIYAYITLMEGSEPTDAIRKQLVTAVRSEIGPFAAPDVIHWAPGLPKTRSGKIMRRILRKIACAHAPSNPMH